jgi:glycosyltransferase involved in cell wall biosynthesis
VAPAPPPYGGMSVQAEKLYSRLLGEGISVELISTNPAPPELLRVLAQIPGIRTILREIQYLISLIRIVRHPGVVHHFSASYLFFFLHTAPLLLLARIFSVKLVLNYRGGAAADFLQNWSWAAVPLLKSADELAVPSKFLQQLFHSFGLDSVVVPNVADVESFPFVERQQFHPRLFVSRNLEPIYDVECVLRAFRIVQSKMPKATLTIAGEGSEASKLRSLVKKLCLRGVSFYGAVPYQDLPSLYRQNDIYINASRIDNFPGSLVEAACAGLPIVSTRAGGIPEMIHDRETGLLCDIGDARALAGGVLELVEDPGFARGLARAACSWAQQFSWSNVYPQLLRCYGFAATRDLRATPVMAHRSENFITE